jgi:hypothetical protein
MKRLLVVLLVTMSAVGCGLFRRNTPQCASSGVVYEGMPCEDGGAYLGPLQPGPQ